MSFEAFLDDFYKRHPEWNSERPAWGQKAPAKPSQAPQKAVQKPFVEQMSQERLDWQQRAAGEEERDWDAEEPQ